MSQSSPIIPGVAVLEQDDAERKLRELAETLGVSVDTLRANPWMVESASVKGFIDDAPISQAIPEAPIETAPKEVIEPETGEIIAPAAPTEETPFETLPGMTDVNFDINQWKKDAEDAAGYDKREDDGSLDFRAKDFMELAPEEYIKRHSQRAQVKPIRIMEDEELDAIIASGPEHPNYKNAWNERNMRDRFERNSTYENLRDPDYLRAKGEGFINQITASIPRIPGDAMTVAGAVMAGGSLIEDAFGVDAGLEKAAKATLETAQEYYDAINEILQVRNPQNPVETLGSIGPGALIRAPVSVGRGLVPNALELLTPITMGGGAGRTAANIGSQFAFAEAMRPIFAPETDQYKTIFQEFFSPEEAIAAGSDPSLDFKIGKTIDGADVRNNDLRAVGALGLGTIGLMFAPRVVQALKATPLVDRSRVIDPTGVNYPRTLRTTVKASDLLRTYLADPVAGMFSAIRRQGIDTKDMADNADVSNSAVLGAKINQAIFAPKEGKMFTMDGTYSSPISVGRLLNEYNARPDLERAAANRYADIQDKLEQINDTGKAWGANKSALIAEARTLENAHPFIRAMQEGLRRTNAALIDFLGSGKYATLTQSQVRALKRSRANHINRETDIDVHGVAGHAESETAAFLNLKRRETIPGPVNEDAYGTLVRSTEHALRTQALNALRGTIIDSIKRAPFGKNFVYRAKKGDLSKNPRWRQKTVSFYRKGKKETYVLPQFLADVLKFDPNFMTFSPILNAASRTFQFNTTGPGAPWFAPLRFMRDTQLVQIATPEGYRHLGVYVPGTKIPVPLPGAAQVRALAGVFEQWIRKSQAELASQIYKAQDSGSGSILKQVFDGLGGAIGKSGDELMQTFADRMAKSYYDSTYYMITGAGGPDVSQARSHIVRARGAIEEALSQSVPSHLKTLGHLWINMLDPIQNSAIYTLMARNARLLNKKYKGKVPRKELDKLVQDLKVITGDPTVTGRSFARASRGDRDRIIGIDEDLSGLNYSGFQKGLKPVLETAAKTTQFLRESSPFFNATVQGLRRIGMAYWENPIRFTARLWLGVGAPTILSYVSAKIQGDEYIDHMMTRRSEYDKSSKLYIAIPGKPPEEGIEIPMPLEVAPVGYMILNAIDHFFRSTDDQAAWTTVMGQTLTNMFGLTMPPVISGVGSIVTGQKLPGSIFGFGEGSYTPSENKYSPLPQNVELLFRSIFGSAADVYIGGLNATMEEGDVLSGLNEMGYVAKQKTPLIKEKQYSSYIALNQSHMEQVDKLDQFTDLYDIHIRKQGVFSRSKDMPMIPGAAEVKAPTERAGLLEPPTLNLAYRHFVDKDHIVQALPFRLSDGRYALMPTAKENMTDIAPRIGKRGKLLTKKMENYYKNTGYHYGVFDSQENALAYLKELQSNPKILAEPLESRESIRPGRAFLPPPTNPVYILAGEKLYSEFKTNQHNFKDMTQRLGDDTRAVQSLKLLNSGSLEQWKKHIEAMPDGPVKRELSGLDLSSRDSIREAINYYEKDRVLVLRRVQTLIRAVEKQLSDEISEIAGKDVQIDLMTLDPWKEDQFPGIQMPGGVNFVPPGGIGQGGMTPETNAPSMGTEEFETPVIPR